MPLTATLAPFSHGSSPRTTLTVFQHTPATEYSACTPVLVAVINHCAPAHQRCSSCLLCSRLIAIERQRRRSSSGASCLSPQPLFNNPRHPHRRNSRDFAVPVPLPAVNDLKSSDLAVIRLDLFDTADPVSDALATASSIIRPFLPLAPSERTMFSQALFF
jgi:hypothetical protein